MPDHKPRGGYHPNPSPPPDSSGVTWTGGVSRTTVAGITALVLFVVLFPFMLSNLMKVQQAHMDFMAACIEFHSADRCRELLFYGRTDLARKDMKP